MNINENAGFDWTRQEIPEWLHKNVKPHLKPRTCSHLRCMIGENMRVYLTTIRDLMIDRTEKIDIWAYYGASDWIIFRNLLGGFWSIPEGITKWHRELAEIADIRPKKCSETQHNALSDAMWNWSVWTINTQEKLV
jgi:hypothetical protein